MGTNSDPDVASGATDVQKLTTSWIIPVITAAVLAVLFCAYYFVYVGSRREYLANRNFRALALLGEQLQQTISVHGNILEFCANLSARKQPRHRQKEDLARFLLVRSEDKGLPPADKEREALKDYLTYLAPAFELTEVPHQTAKSKSRLQVERHNDRWDLILTPFRHEGTDRDYRGSLRINELMQPLVGSLPFDDILLVSKEGTIVYQSKHTGPQFTTLSGLLQAQIPSAESSPAGKSAGQPEPSDTASESQVENRNVPVNQNADPAWHTKSLHLTEVKLAGTRYKLFLQPVLVSSFLSETDAEPASEWVLCGLISSSALDWEALSLSYTFFIWFTVVFFVIWTSYKVLKLFFMNSRERLRVRELGTLGLSLVLLTSAITLSFLQLDFRANDDTDTRLQDLGRRISRNVHEELRLMSDQLTAWCASGDLHSDLKEVVTKDKEIIRNVSADDPLKGAHLDPTPVADKYPYLNNAFWTDDDGHQIVKWSTMAYVTPMIDIAELSISARPNMHLDNSPTAFHFASILPPNKLEHLATLSMRTRDCAQRPGDALHNLTLARQVQDRDDILDGSAFVAAQPLSLIDPILPYGYGFALVDEAGSVLFDFDKARNGRENFLLESDGNKELYAALFGHASQHSLPVKYMGKDYRTVVFPVENVGQAPWSLVIYRDLTSVRTLDLQIMTVVSTLLFLVLAGPVALIAIWCAIRRPPFAPEWLWPNPGRLGSYLDQICVYTVLIILFLFIGFSGSSERIVIACAAVPYTALLLTWWCFRGGPSETGRLRPRKGNRSLAASAAAIVLLTCMIQRAPSKKAGFLFGNGILAAVSLLARPRHHLMVTLNGWRTRSSVTESRSCAFFNYKNCYMISVLQLLLLIGVLVPMALFHASMDVERRLEVKQAQRHLASAIAQRWTRVVEQHQNGELNDAAWCAFQGEAACKTQQSPWRWIVPSGLTGPDGQLQIVEHTGVSRELYSDWFRRLLYSLHHDYNQSSAEMLAVLRDSGNSPDWSWDNQESKITLRWHGFHPPALRSAMHGDSVHADLLISSSIPAWSGRHAATNIAIAGTVTLVIGGLFWALTRKIFRLDIAPLKRTGARQVTELLGQGKNVLVLLPPVSNWKLDGPKWILDLTKVPTSARWAEVLDLGTIPLNTVIEILHFEFSANDAEADNQKFILLDRLLKREDTQIAAIMTVPESSVDYRRMFRDLEVIDLREEPFPWLEKYAGPAQDLLWTECGVMSALWPIGAQLAKDISTETVVSKDTIVSEILERADPYYRLIWNECSNEQKFVLFQLSEDGMLNTLNGRAIRHLMRMGLIVKDPQFRIMNESFRRFLRSAPTVQLRRQWLQESRRSGWGKVRGAFFLTMSILGIFLLATQNALWQSAAAYVTTALGALGTLAKLSDTFRSRGITDKTH